MYSGESRGAHNILDGPISGCRGLPLIKKNSVWDLRQAWGDLQCKFTNQPGNVLTDEIKWRAASGGALAPEPPRATHSPEFVQKNSFPFFPTSAYTLLQEQVDFSRINSTFSKKVDSEWCDFVNNAFEFQACWARESVRVVCTLTLAHTVVCGREREGGLDGGRGMGKGTGRHDWLKHEWDVASGSNLHVLCVSMGLPIEGQKSTVCVCMRTCVRVLTCVWVGSPKNWWSTQQLLT